MIVALSTGVEIAWWVALGVGLVVSLVVWFLLEWLRRTVLAVDAGVTAVWTMGKRVAQNTATTHVLLKTRERVHEEAGGGDGVDRISLRRNSFASGEIREGARTILRPVLAGHDRE